MKSYDILVAGEINPDLILSGNVVPEFGQVEKLVDRATLTIGSSSAIFACGAKRLGLDVAFIGVCGEDVFGSFMLNEMQKRNVDVSNVIVRPGEQTGFSVILNQEADRAILTYPGLMPALHAEDISDTLLRRARHIHVASYFLQTNLQPGMPALFRRAHSLGLTTSLDTNYDPSEKWLGFDELLSVTDIFFPNKTEALSITGTNDVESAGKQLANRSKLVAIKLGRDGAVLQANDQMISVQSIPVNIVDTIGAGDAFDAGFLYGYLNRWDLEKTLRLAVVCGALSTQAQGGTAAQPTLEEAFPFLP
ncbi:MAG TPA: carbohydrate kinase family protein [Anaerolineales bacterium]|nr:carbohydrate kinase family protein [Anaerolineales bacterium]